MKKVSILQVCDFKLWEKCFLSLSKLVDEFYIRVDRNNTSKEIREYLKGHPKVKCIIEGDYHPRKFIWREELLRLLDDVQPDIVCSLDIDEIFEDSIYEELVEFCGSDKKAMMFKYLPCPSESGGSTIVYPLDPHMKIFKWNAGLSYTRYKKRGQITEYANNPKLLWNASTKINHYCMWTEEMREAKYKFIQKYYGKNCLRGYLKGKVL